MVSENVWCHQIAELFENKLSQQSNPRKLNMFKIKQFERVIFAVD